MNTMNHHEIDAASLGGEWRGDCADIDSFCVILQDEIDNAGVTDIKIIPHTDTFNGGEMWTGDGSDADRIPEKIWNAALDKHAERFPQAWA